MAQAKRKNSLWILSGHILFFPDITKLQLYLKCYSHTLYTIFFFYPFHVATIENRKMKYIYSKNKTNVCMDTKYLHVLTIFYVRLKPEKYIHEITGDHRRNILLWEQKGCVSTGSSDGNSTLSKRFNNGERGLLQFGFHVIPSCAQVYLFLYFYNIKK